MDKSKTAYENIWLWIILTFFIGSFWHFGYEIFDKTYLTGLIFPINESVWEHLKIVYWPLLLMGLLQYKIKKNDQTNFGAGMLFGLITGMAVTFFGYYLYSSIIGESLLIDILLFFIAIAIGFYVAAYTHTKNISMSHNTISAVGIAIIGITLGYLTINPPKVGPFIEKSSGTYGIDRKTIY